MLLWEKLARRQPGGQPPPSVTRRIIVVRVSITFALSGLLFASLSGSQSSTEQLQANEFVRQIINNELQSERNDHSHWMLRLETQQSGKVEVREVVETKDGDLDWLISVDEKPLAEDQQRERERGLWRLIRNPAELKKSQREREQDLARSQRLLKMLPDALVFDYGEQRGGLQEVKFKPNPHFRPPSHEASVFHAMEGTLWFNAKQKRIAEISGHLTRPVKFAGGLLGHLDAGGKLYVKQEEVQPGYWELAALNVDLKGRALFFKTIGVQEKIDRSRFRRVPDDLTPEQGAKLLYQQVKTINGGVSGAGRSISNFGRRGSYMQATSTPIVRIRQAANTLHIPADCLKRFEDGTALVRFAAGNFLIVPIDLIESATDAEAREYYRVRESWPPRHPDPQVPPIAQKPRRQGSSERIPSPQQYEQM